MQGEFVCIQIFSCCAKSTYWKLSFTLQVDPYDYDSSLFILKLVKELSHEGAPPAVDKVKMQWTISIYLVYIWK